MHRYQFFVILGFSPSFTYPFLLLLSPPTHASAISPSSILSPSFLLSLPSSQPDAYPWTRRFAVKKCSARIFHPSRFNLLGQRMSPVANLTRKFGQTKPWAVRFVRQQESAREIFLEEKAPAKRKLVSSSFLSSSLLLSLSSLLFFLLIPRLFFSSSPFTPHSSLPLGLLSDRWIYWIMIW